MKILDFGLARAAAGDAKLTQSGTILGTPAYMAPEQADGQPIDTRADLFSLGCVLYRTATGEVPFKGDGVMQILRAIALTEPKKPHEVNPEIPSELSELIMELLAKRSGDRPASAEQVIQRLRILENAAKIGTPFGQAGTYIQPSISESRAISRIPVTGTSRRPRWLPWVIAATLLLMIGGAGYLVYPQIIIRFTDEKGQKNELALPMGAKDVEIVRPSPPVVPTGEPLSPLALVTNPARIKGVLSWTLETRNPRGGIDIGTHGGSICSYAFSPDYRWLATFGKDACVRIWDTKDGSLAKVFLGHESGWYYMHSIMGGYPNTYIESLSWSPDSTKLASGSLGPEPVQVWDVSSGRRLFGLASGESRAFSVRWSPDGKVIATGHNYGRVLLWNAATGNREFYLGRHDGCVKYMAWSGDSKLLASNEHNYYGKGKVILWDPVQGRQLDEILRNKAYPLSLSPKGDMLCLGYESWSLARNDQAKKSLTLELFKSDQGSPNFLWLDGETKLAYGGSLYDTKTGKALSADPDKEPQMPKKWLSKGTLRFLAKNTGIAVYANYPGEILDAQTGAKLAVIAAHPVDVPSVSCAPDGKLLAASDGFSKIAIWDLGRLELSVISAGLWDNPHTPVGTWRWSMDSKRVYPFFSWGGLRAFDIPNRRFLSTSPMRVLTGAVTTSVPYLGAASDGHVDLYEADKFRKVRQIGEKKDDIQQVSLSPNGDYLLTTDKKNSRVLLWKTDAPGTPIKALDGTSFPCLWSPDGQWFVTKGGLLWNGKTGILERDLKIAGTIQTWLADSKHIAGGDADGKLGFWDVIKGQQVRKSPVTTEVAAIFPDGKMGAVPFGPGCFSVISLETGKGLATFVLMDKERWAVISADGHFKGSPNVEHEFVYVVKTERGQETLTPAEMEKKYGWKNDPAKVRLAP